MLKLAINIHIYMCVYFYYYHYYYFTAIYIYIITSARGVLKGVFRNIITIAPSIKYIIILLLWGVNLEIRVSIKRLARGNCELFIEHRTSYLQQIFRQFNFSIQTND